MSHFSFPKNQKNKDNKYINTKKPIAEQAYTNLGIYGKEFREQWKDT